MDFIQTPSPNFDERRQPLSMLVLHYTGMETGQRALERMCDPEAKVAAHYMVEEDGRIFQLVDEAKRAWHAGVASWNGVEDINSRSIGVEIVNGGHDYGLPDYPREQMEAVIALCKDIQTRNSILPADIVGHSDIAPGRKLDPGEHFPWQQLAENGIGVWPPMDRLALSVGDISQLIDIGYNVSAMPDEEEHRNLITAFQQRWLPNDVTGEGDLETLCRISQIAEVYLELRN